MRMRCGISILLLLTSLYCDFRDINHIEFSDGTLPIFQNFLKDNFVNERDLSSFKFTAIKWFLKVRKNQQSVTIKLYVDKLMNKNV